MVDLEAILGSALFAARNHKEQTRKGRDEPYINHPLEVADILVRVGKVVESDVVMAALLHDVVEDCDVTFDEIADRYGESVAAYVRELTDDMSLPKRERKRRQVEHAPHMSLGAKQIKIADKISNIRDVTQNPPEHWSAERFAKYVDWGEEVVAGLRGSNAALEKLFDEAAAEARNSRKKFKKK